MKRAIVLVDHGSKREEANRVVGELADRLGTATGEPVYPCHMELAEPTISQAVERAVAEGADFLYVFPFFLVPGRHSREDIPRMVSEAAGRHPGIGWRVDEPFGAAAEMVSMILERMRRFESHGE